MARLWTDTEDNALRAAVDNKQWAQVASELGRTYSAVTGRANVLGLKHSTAFIASITKNKWKSGAYTPERNNCFKPGHTPPNKGKKQAEYMSQEAIARTAPTRFVKGQVPHNHKPVGFERAEKDGYIYIKIAEPNVFMLKHRYVWQQHHGTIAPGVNIQFVDGDKTNCNIENLYAISRRDQIDNNTIHRYPQEVKQLIKTQKKLEQKLKIYATK